MSYLTSWLVIMDIEKLMDTQEGMEARKGIGDHEKKQGSHSTINRR